MTDATHQFIVILSIIVIGGVSAWCLFDCWRSWYAGKIMAENSQMSSVTTITGINNDCDHESFVERARDVTDGLIHMYGHCESCGSLMYRLERSGDESIRRTAENRSSNAGKLRGL